MTRAACSPAVAETLAELHSKRTAIDVAIRNLEDIFGESAAMPAVANEVESAPKARAKRKATEPTPAVEPERLALPGLPGLPTFRGQYDERVYKAVSLAPACGLTPREVVVAVVGRSNVESRFTAVYAAACTLAKRGLIRKDGRFFHPIVKAE